MQECKLKKNSSCRDTEPRNFFFQIPTAVNVLPVLVLYYRHANYQTRCFCFIVKRRFALDSFRANRHRVRGISSRAGTSVVRRGRIRWLGARVHRVLYSRALQARHGCLRVPRWLHWRRLPGVVCAVVLERCSSRLKTCCPASWTVDRCSIYAVLMCGSVCFHADPFFPAIGNSANPTVVSILHPVVCGNELRGT